MVQLKTTLLRTPLYAEHLALGAKLVDFGGWEMPLYYSSVTSEHMAVREHAGIFDVSHMGRIEVIGPEAESLLDFLSTASVIGKKEGSATYTVWCNEQGFAIEDLIVYRLNEQKFFVVANAANREAVLQHLLSYAKGKQVQILPHFQDAGILAIQGPQAIEKMVSSLPGIEKLKPMHCGTFIYEHEALIAARTGYTGSGGIEVFGSGKAIAQIWQAGLAKGIQPVGLGARDTLRLEMGYALYGHELTTTIAPIESVAAWTVKTQHEFIGKQALLDLQAKPHRQQEGIVVQKGIAREGCQLFCGAELVGAVTSGTFSPILGKGIAIAMFNRPLDKAEALQVQIRQELVPATLSDLPFIHI